MPKLLNKPLRISKIHRWVGKALVHLVTLGYLSLLLIAGLNDSLGADPVKTLLHNSGQTSVILLLITLSISPLAKHLPCGDLMRFRRLFGVYAFVAAVFHLSVFTLFDLQLDLALLAAEIIDRPYITVGMVAALILLALAVTSFDRVRRVMGQRWQVLHRSTYLAVILALVHFSWSEKTLLQTSIYYWAIALVLLSFRWPNLRGRPLSFRVYNTHKMNAD